MSHPCPQKAPAARKQQGFTAIELLVVVAILGLLAAIAAPNFTPLLERWRVRLVAEDLLSTLSVARTEAIRRGGNIVLRRNSASATDCPGITDSANDWGCGWHVFVDNNSNNQQEGNEPLLRLSQTPRNIQVLRSANSAYIRLDRWGEHGIGTYGFRIYPNNANSQVSSALCVSSGGRIEIREGVTAC